MDEGLAGNNHSSVRIIIQYNTRQLKSSSIGIFTPNQSLIPVESAKVISYRPKWHLDQYWIDG